MTEFTNRRMTKTHALPPLICSALGDWACPPLGTPPTHTTSTVPAWTPAGAVGPRARMHPAGGAGSRPPSSAHLPFLLEGRWHPGDREDPRGEEQGGKGRSGLAQSPSLPSVPVPRPRASPSPGDVRLRAPSGWTGSMGWSPAAAQAQGTALHTCPASCPPPRSRSPAPYLGAWVPLLSWGARLSLGTLQDAKQRH